jgi:hypothetical protein
MKRGSWCSQLRNSNYYLHSGADKKSVAFKAFTSRVSSPKSFASPGKGKREGENYKAVNLFALLKREEILVDLHFYGRSLLLRWSREKGERRGR